MQLKKTVFNNLIIDSEDHSHIQITVTEDFQVNYPDSLAIFSNIVVLKNEKKTEGAGLPILTTTTTSRQDKLSIILLYMEEMSNVVS